MCGIVGYIGVNNAISVLLSGLKRLEYRGYDSAGLAYLVTEGAPALIRRRACGKLTQLEALFPGSARPKTSIGLGHTRWATHGAPTEDNAHPHSDCSGELVLVHNGIIENYSELKHALLARGHVFQSDTDTEVLAHLIEEHLSLGLAGALRAALTQVRGSYALAVLWLREPEMLVAALRQSTLVLGFDAQASYLASDVPALLPYTNKVLYLGDGEMALLRRGSCEILRLDNGQAVKKTPVTIEWTAAMTEKGGYPHFMLKEIFEQPIAIRNTIAGRIIPDTGAIVLPELKRSAARLSQVGRIVLVACGTSWHAALVAKYWLEKWARLPVEVDIASEFRYRSAPLDENALCIVISQSGETADTLAGMHAAGQLGAQVLAICNVADSIMAREAKTVLYTHAGPEIGVASTKAFTCQLTALFLFALYLAQTRGLIDREEQKKLGLQLINLLPVMEGALAPLRETIREIVGAYYEARDFLFVGRGLCFPIALEGALKLKEISYIHAEGYAAGELKHGPIALIDQHMPVVALAPQGPNYQKIVSNISEIKARQGRLIIFGSQGDELLPRLTHDFIALPPLPEDLNPLLYAIPAQLLAYEMAVRLGRDVDQPRNLAKSVTVE